MNGKEYYMMPFFPQTMSSVRHTNFNRAIVLSLLMMMMTQVGYLESMNPWTNGEETLDETTDAFETGGSGSSQSNFTASVEGADLIIDEAMTNITFLYDANAASGSSSGSIVGPYNGNGTAWMVKDICSGSCESNPHSMTAFGDTLYFSAGYGSQVMWKSDGTASGTVMVKDINSGGFDSITDITALGNTIYFRADDGTNSGELWKSDGTSSGTVMVQDIRLSLIHI